LLVLLIYSMWFRHLILSPSVSHASPFSIMETERGEELLARKEIYTEKNLAAVSDQKEKEREKQPHKFSWCQCMCR